MSMKSAPYYWIVCDGCQVSAEDGGDYAAWGDPGQASTSAEDGDFLRVEGGLDLCPDCRGTWTVCQGCDAEPLPTEVEALAVGFVKDDHDEWFCAACINESGIPS